MCKRKALYVRYWAIKYYDVQHKYELTEIKLVEKYKRTLSQFEI